MASLPQAIYLIHYIVVNAIEKNLRWLATVKPLLVLVTFVIATLHAAVLDIFVDSYFRRFAQKASLSSALNRGISLDAGQPEGVRSLGTAAAMLPSHKEAGAHAGSGDYRRAASS